MHLLYEVHGYLSELKDRRLALGKHLEARQAVTSSTRSKSNVKERHQIIHKKDASLAELK